jgi:predicted amidohydrolase YtcJ
VTATLVRGGRILLGEATLGEIDEVELIVVEDRIAWIGRPGSAPCADVVVDVHGALVLPAFVDGHVHATDTGLTLAGLDLSRARSKADLLDAVARRTRELRGRPVLGHGWDETSWEDRDVPTAAELDRASYGSVVYLSRVDVHSALASSALMAEIRDLAALEGFSATGWLTRDAHHAVRGAALSSITDSQRRDAQTLALRHAASRGIAAVHEMAGPAISGTEDTAALLALAAERDLPDVVAYWGQTAADGGLDTMRRLGAHGAGGDLFVDGAVGSRTACVREAYADAPGTRGSLYLGADAVADHVARCSEAGVQAGFHVIGDAAMDTVVAGLRQAVASVGVDRVRAQRHRLEHAEMLDADQVALLAALGVIASVQPGFDAAWGGEQGMYVERLGEQRGVGLNPYADLESAGVPLVFGSDSPVTPLDPWGAVRAAVHHRTPHQRVSLASAFDAHTRAGHAAVGDHASGSLEVGAPATYAVWTASVLPSGWPDLSSGVPPTCLRTVVRGRTVHDSGVLEEVAA